MKRKIKIISIIIVVLLIIAAGVVFVFRKQIIAHIIPEVIQSGTIDIKVVNDTSYITTRLIIKNKTFLKINIDTIKYKISLFNETYMKNEKFLGIVMPSYGSDSVDLYLKIPYAIIIKKIQSERKINDSAAYSINVSLQYSTNFWKSEVPVNKSGKIKIPEPPEFKIEDVKFKEIHLKTILADITVKITNHSEIALAIEDLTYNLDISNRGKIKGNYKITTNIKPKGSTIVTIPITIHTKNIGKTTFDILTNRDKYKYTLKIQAALKSTQPQERHFSVDIDNEGELELKK